MLQWKDITHGYIGFEDMLFDWLCLTPYAGYLPFIDLSANTSTDVNRTYLAPEDDDTSSAIEIPIEFAFGNSSQTNVYVSIVLFCM